MGGWAETGTSCIVRNSRLPRRQRLLPSRPCHLGSQRRPHLRPPCLPPPNHQFPHATRRLKSRRYGHRSGSFRLNRCRRRGHRRDRSHRRSLPKCPPSALRSRRRWQQRARDGQASRQRVASCEFASHYALVSLAGNTRFSAQPWTCDVDSRCPWLTVELANHCREARVHRWPVVRPAGHKCHANGRQAPSGCRPPEPPMRARPRQAPIRPPLEHSRSRRSPFRACPSRSARARRHSTHRSASRKSARCGRQSAE